tara:strand:- start:7028 stop:13555 length:6528 start_codon:yes stop_codon:yes gene_type:complete
MRILLNTFFALFMGLISTTNCGLNTTIAHSQTQRGFAMQNNTTLNYLVFKALNTMAKKRQGRLPVATCGHVPQAYREMVWTTLASRPETSRILKRKLETFLSKTTPVKQGEYTYRLFTGEEIDFEAAEAEARKVEEQAEAEAIEARKAAHKEARKEAREEARKTRLAANKAKAEARKAKAAARREHNNTLKQKSRAMLRTLNTKKGGLMKYSLCPSHVKAEARKAKAERKAAKAKAKAERKAATKSAEIADVTVEYFDDFNFEITSENGASLLEKVISRFAKSNLGNLLNVSMVTPIATNMLDTQREKKALGAKSLLQDDIRALMASTGYNILPCIRFGKSKKGTPNTSAGNSSHSDDKEVKGTATRLTMKGGAGRFLASFNTTVEKILADLSLEISGDNAILYEIDDINSKELMKNVADILLDSGYVSICRGFAVKLGTDLCDAFIALMDEMFKNAVEQRGYARSAITTPNQAELPHGIPTLSGYLSQFGWKGNDGGTIFTAGLMTAIQNRARTIGLGREGASKGLFKGLSTAAKFVGMQLEDGSWTAYNYSYDKQVDKGRKATLKRLKKTTPLQNINSADKAMLMSMDGVGNATADALVKVRKDGDFTSFQDLVDRVIAHKKGLARYLVDIEKKACMLQYAFVVNGATYIVCQFLDADQNKGNKTKFPKTGLKFEGLQGIDIYNWAITLDAPMDTAKISLGWQVTQLLDEEFVKQILAEGGLAAQQLRKMFKRILDSENKLVSAFAERLNGVDGATNSINQAQKALALMKLMGKKQTERISSGFGLKAESRYIQMIDLGQEVAIDRLQGNKWRTHAFFGRTPNQGHDTVRCPKVLDIGFIAELLDAYNMAEDKSDLGTVMGKFSTRGTGLSKNAEAVRFIEKVQARHGSDADNVLMFLRALLPSVAEGSIIVDTTLQEAVCGDNDGDRNMLSYNPLLVALAKNIEKKHPSVLPAKEQSKAFVVNAFDPIITKEGGVKEAYEAAKAGNKDLLRKVQRFLNAPGNSPGQDNVGGPTLSAAAPLNFHTWGHTDRGYHPMNPMARKYMDFLYALQQTGIDLQKYERVTHSVEYWYEGEYSNDGWILPGKYIDGKQWVVVDGKTCHAANVTESEAKVIAAKHPGSKVVNCPNHFPIYGMRGVTFDQYRNMDLETWEDADEQVPLMVWSKDRRAASLRTPMWDNGGLFNHAAWTVSALNMGLPYLTFGDMSELQDLFDCSTKVPKANWEELAKWFNNRRTSYGLSPVTAQQVEYYWVWPKMVSSYQKLGYMKDNTQAPGVFSSMRARIKAIYEDVCSIECKGMSDFMKPEFMLSESRFAEFVSQAVDNKAYIPYFDGWKAEQIMRAMYFAYIDKAIDAAQAKSQSEKTQIDQVSSGSDMKQYLRAALGSNSFLSIESDQLKYLRQFARTWRNALSVRALSNEDKMDALGGMMILAIRAIDSMGKREVNDLEAGVDFLSELVKTKDCEFLIDIMGNYPAFKQWADTQFEGEDAPMLQGRNKSEMITLHQQYKAAQKVCSLESVQEFLIASQSLANVSKAELYHVAATESEDLTGKITEWIASEYFGALEEAYEDMERSDNRQDSTDRVLELVEKATYGESLVDDIAKILGADLSTWIQNEAKTTYGLLSLNTAEEVFAFYRENRSALLAGFKAYASPIVQVGRLVEYANKVIVKDDIMDMNMVNNQFDEIVRGGIFEVDEEGVESVRSVIEFPVPEDCKLAVAHEALMSGHNLEFLTQVPRLGVTRQDKDARCYMDTTVATDWGYIFIDSPMYQMAVCTFGEFDAIQWLQAQFRCGVGHVTTADHVFLAYGLWTFKNPQSDCKTFHYDFEDSATCRATLGLDDSNWFRPYHLHAPIDAGDVRDSVIVVQEFFMTTYPHSIVIDLDYKDSIDVPNFREMEDGDRAQLLYEMQLTKTVWMPTYYGAKSKAPKLFASDLKDSKALPSQMYRYYGFTMAGCGDKQQSRGQAPAEVFDFMKAAFDNVKVGIFKDEKLKGRGSSMQWHSALGAAQIEENKQTRAKDSLFHGDFELWVANGAYENASPGYDGSIRSVFKTEITGDNGVTLPSPLNASIQGLDALVNHPDSWRGMSYLMTLSPSLLFCLVGIANEVPDDDNGDGEDMRARMMYSVRNQSVSSVRKLFGQITKTYGVDTTLLGVNTPVNPEWDVETMKHFIMAYNGFKA